MTLDDACTLTITTTGGFPTLVQTEGWSDPDITNDGVGKFIIWDEGSMGFIEPRTGNTYRERIIRCLWKDRIRIQWLLAGPPPAVHPDDASMAVQSISDEGIVGENTSGYAQGMLAGTVGQVAFTYARLRIRYTPWIAFTVDEDFGVEPLIVSGVGAIFKWPDGSDVDPTECPSVRQSTAVYRLTRYDFLTIPNFSAFNGCVNDTAIVIDGVAKGAGTLLMDGAQTRVIVQSIGQPYKVFEIVFKYMPHGWNYFFRPSTGMFEAVINNNGQPPYLSAALSTFFAL